MMMMMKKCRLPLHKLKGIVKKKKNRLFMSSILEENEKYKIKL
jgi:hypothetical protein